MSKLKFNGNTHQIELTDTSGKVIGNWAAYNNVDSHATLRHVGNGSYTILDQRLPHHHTANANGPYGSYGIIRFNVPGHPGVGIHSGRANARHLPGPQHPTMGCIRTSDDAMLAIARLMSQDALTSIEVTNNSVTTARAASAQNRIRQDIVRHTHD